ncbi:malignant fibrous histiocytoma-amplified sequence 1-like [Anguilla anguilla]|uniref:malignant fibrous histiocytoma-amplified sequence 1-like n=1 Tax=Anguilla anguilla TaxID=7936 RepID=UPI0015A9CE9F|nr:malignant fibrous histiocytoma-amplified sequence 1-like [Anguilla anguilla]
MAQSNDFKPREKSDFSRQKLKKLPKEVLCLSTDVLSLNLKNNRLKSVSGISALCYLKELNLSANDLSEFPQEIEELSNLEILYLSQNNITKIPEGVFSQLEKLQFLKLSTNCLKELPLDLGQCKSLRYLNLSNNHLEDVKVLEALCGLKELYVKNNKLTELPARLFLNTDLTKFKADGNPLRKPPEEVCAGGVKSIKHYFSSLGISEQRVRRVKTMFLGSSMAGKSTICYSLRKGLPVEVDVADRTVGIEISEVQLGGVHFLFWDFAGHEEYYFTHHVFITPQAFVILTVNLASYDIKNPQSFKDCVSFWIKNVQLRVPNAVVLVVGTHSDECRGVEDVQEKKEDIDKKIRDMLQERKANLERSKSNFEEDQNKTAQSSDQLRKFQHCAEHNIKVLDLVAMDCTKPEEIEKIQNCILCQVKDKTLFPNIEKILPQLYQEVESSIKELKEDTDFSGHGVMSFEEILNELKGKLEKLDQEDLQPILRYLHQIGIIVWYEEIADLKETVFVEPSFLIKLFKTVVRHDLVDQLQGISRDELMEEGSLSVQRDKWINDLKGKATLHSAAIRVLLRKSLRKELEIDDKDFFDVVVGTRSSDGMVLGLLQQFEICLPAQLTSPLNPKARDFVPNERWEPLDTSVYNRDGACLFPSHLKDNSVVLKMWGEDRNDDIQVQVYFLPEMPHGFFQRLIIKICSFYPVHWVGKDHCLVCAGNRLVLFKEKCLRGDQLIEIRCKRQHHSAHVNTAVDMRCPSWDMILVVLRRLIELAQQWPGLCLYVCSPCTEDGCSDHFAWPDWKELNGHNLYNIQKDDKMVCCHGHTHRTELLFPKVPKARSKSDND